jgi:hypothetical protein
MSLKPEQFISEAEQSLEQALAQLFNEVEPLKEQIRI